MIKHLNVKSVAALAAGVATASLAAPFLASAGTDGTRDFGCLKGDRIMAARAFYASSGPNHWLVTQVKYAYKNSGGGKANSSFRLNDRDNSVAWTYDTPDNRTNRGYKKAVNARIRRGGKARIWQKTWFDTSGNDPTCSKAGRFPL